MTVSISSWVDSDMYSCSFVQHIFWQYNESWIFCRRNISGQEFGGMYCIVLIVKYVTFAAVLIFHIALLFGHIDMDVSYLHSSVVISAGLLRIFGRNVAELPLVATSREYQGKVSSIVIHVWPKIKNVDWWVHLWKIIDSRCLR